MLVLVIIQTMRINKERVAADSTWLLGMLANGKSHTSLGIVRNSAVKLQQFQQFLEWTDTTFIYIF